MVCLDKNIKITKANEQGEFVVDLKKGQQAVLLPNFTKEPLVIKEMNNDRKLFNSYGVKKGQQIIGNEFWKE